MIWSAQYNIPPTPAAATPNFNHEMIVFAKSPRPGGAAGAGLGATPCANRVPAAVSIEFMRFLRVGRAARPTSAGKVASRYREQRMRHRLVPQMHRPGR